MASYDPIIRRNENLFRAPDKIQSKAGRKPLGDVTNSSKPLGKDKSSANVFKAPEKVQPKATGRKPLGDLTNAKRPQAQEKTSKKNCTANISAIKEEQGYNWVKDEGFLHNHDECIKAQRQAEMMSMDYFLETVGLKKDLPASVSKPQKVPEAFEHKFEPTELEFEMMDVLSPPTPSTPRSPGSHSWIMALELSPLKLKDSPVRM